MKIDFKTGAMPGISFLLIIILVVLGIAFLIGAIPLLILSTIFGIGNFSLCNSILLGLFIISIIIAWKVLQ